MPSGSVLPHSWEPISMKACLLRRIPEGSCFSKLQDWIFEIFKTKFRFGRELFYKRCLSTDPVFVGCGQGSREARRRVGEGCGGLFGSLVVVGQYSKAGILKTLWLLPLQTHSWMLFTLRVNICSASTPQTGSNSGLTCNLPLSLIQESLVNKNRHTGNSEGGHSRFQAWWLHYVTPLMATGVTGVTWPLQDSLALRLIAKGGRFLVPSLRTHATCINWVFLEPIKNQLTEKDEKDSFSVKQDNPWE